MTESSGVFTFPTTGIYLVKMFVTTSGDTGLLWDTPTNTRPKASGS
ncbi:MAG: hypothetical protein CM15mV138_320 [Caudoviricetes sp.]|nr:MAG: hypothetical protein CM15mV138_320 [Caudoviricetes sp.]